MTLFTGYSVMHLVSCRPNFCKCEPEHTLASRRHESIMVSPKFGAMVSLVFCIALVLVAPVAWSQAQLPRHKPPPNPDRQIPASVLPAHVSNGFTVAAVGDMILSRPINTAYDPEFLAVEKLIQGADVSFVNFEGSLLSPGELRIWPAPENGGNSINGPPSLAAEIKQMGFDIASHANNHTTDWGIKGMEATDDALTSAGIMHAGTGKSLALARAPNYLTTSWGRIALEAMTSSFTPMEPAGEPLRGVAARPGVNALQTTLFHVVTAQQMDWLRQVYKEQPGASFSFSGSASSEKNQLDLFGVHFLIGAAPGLIYRMNPYDLDQILRNIREGKEQSNFEIVYIHAHQPGNWSDKPPNFMPQLAHDAINAGADEFVSSGPHQLRGIEIYKGKPIFYGLGNFTFLIGQLEFMKPATMQRMNFDLDTTTDHEYEQYYMSRGFGGPIWYESVVAITEFDSGGHVREIKLYPIDLGYKRIPNVDVGVPRLASAELSRTILEQLQQLSKPYGTHIAIQGNIGVIRIGDGE